MVELVSVGDAVFEDLVEAAECLLCAGGSQTETDGLASTGGHVEGIVRGRLGPGLGGVDRLAAARDDVLVERILDVGRRVGLPPEPAGVAFVLGEEQLRGAIALQPILAKLMMGRLNDAGSRLA